MLKAVETTANLTFNKVNDILAAKEGMMKAITDETKIRKPEQLVQMIFTQPLTKVSHITASHIYSECTA